MMSARPGRLVLLDRELVDGEPVVVVWVLEVDDRGWHSGHGPVGSTKLDKIKNL